MREQVVTDTGTEGRVVGAIKHLEEFLVYVYKLSMNVMDEKSGIKLVEDVP
jgi:hypothetical protein